MRSSATRKDFLAGVGSVGAGVSGARLLHPGQEGALTVGGAVNPTFTPCALR